MTEYEDTVVTRARLRVGTVLRQKWRLDALLGVGGMGAVYSATHRNGKRCAVKILHPEFSGNPPMRTRFLREGYVANKIDHPGAVAILDDDESEDGAVFLVMELLDGETLADRRTRCGGVLDIVDIMSITDAVLDVIATAHAKEIIHRDIKPDNIFITREGGVKLLDFGIARVRELTTVSNATRSGAIFGTPGFMAPEQARGRWDSVDERTDIWAVGATVFTTLAGRSVHEAETAAEQLAMAITRAAPSLGSVVPATPRAVVEMVDRALAYEKGDRWASALDMREALRAAYQSLAGGKGPEALNEQRGSDCRSVATATNQLLTGTDSLPPGPSGNLARSPSTASPTAHAPQSPPRRVSRLVIGSALVLAIATVSALVLFKNSLVVRVQDEEGREIPSAEVLIDGSRRCGGSPCEVGWLLPGNHEISAAARGFVPSASATARAQYGSSLPMVVVLRAKSASLRATAGQPGTTIAVDGASPSPLPATIEGLTPGKHSVQFCAGQQFECLAKSVELTGGEIQDLGDIVLPARKATVHFTCRPSCDEVRCDGSIVAVTGEVRLSPGKHTCVASAGSSTRTIALDLHAGESFNKEIAFGPSCLPDGARLFPYGGPRGIWCCSRCSDPHNLLTCLPRQRCEE